MMTALLVALALVAGVGFGVFVVRRVMLWHERERYIRTYVFSKELLAALTKAYPKLQEKDAFLVARALRTYFLIHARTGHELIGMPSKVVDCLWHEFILDTRSYHAFCSRAFGSYFHHVPAKKVAPGVSEDAALRRTWRLACLEENINPKAATRLPLLFAIDSKLQIPEGNRYHLTKHDCPSSPSGAGCGGFGCSGGGLGCADGSSCGGGDGGGCGGGCGGD